MTDIEPDQRVFCAHLQRAAFQSGVDAGLWRLIEISWPNVVLGVAADVRGEAPTEFAFRFELTRYPAAAPTGCPWDLEAGTILVAERRPKGELIRNVVRTDWEGGRALYAPYDRVALESHSNWADQYPNKTWNEARDIAFIMTELSRMLHDEDYTGV